MGAWPRAEGSLPPAPAPARGWPHTLCSAGGKGLGGEGWAGTARGETTHVLPRARLPSRGAGLSAPGATVLEAGAGSSKAFLFLSRGGGAGGVLGEIPLLLWRCGTWPHGGPRPRNVLWPRLPILEGDGCPQGLGRAVSGHSEHSPFQRGLGCGGSPPAHSLTPQLGPRWTPAGP